MFKKISDSTPCAPIRFGCKSARARAGKPRRAALPVLVRSDFSQRTVSLETSSNNRPWRGLRIDIDLESLPEGVKTAQKSPQWLSRAPPKRSKGRLRGFQEAPRGPQQRPKRPRDCPREPQDGPRGRQDGPRDPSQNFETRPDGPPWPKKSPRWAQEGAKIAQGSSNMVHWEGLVVEELLQSFLSFVAFHTNCLQSFLFCFHVCVLELTARKGFLTKTLTLNGV